MRRLKTKYWLSVGALLLVLGGGVLYSGVFAMAFRFDENLVRVRTIDRSGGELLQQMLWKLHALRTRTRPNPSDDRFFGPVKAGSGAIYGFLAQCMDISGTQYFIEKKVAGGKVMFGHTNILNEVQWVQAVEDALQKNSPEWWDSETKKFGSENLVLLRYNKRTVLVLTPKTAQKYREKYPKLAPLER